MTDLTNKEIETALISNDISTIWEIFSSLDIEDEKELKEVYEEVKYGINLDFDIRNITKGYVEELPQFKIVKIAKKWQFEITKYWDELELRKNKMKDELRSRYDDKFDKQEEEEIVGYE